MSRMNVCRTTLQAPYVSSHQQRRCQPAARGGKWSLVQGLLEAGRPFDGASAAAA